MSDDKTRPLIQRLPIRAKEHRVVLKLAEPHIGCQHLRAVVDPKLAQLECADCGEKLNPIQFLVTMANKLTNWEYAQQEFIKARAALEERKKCRCTRCGQITEIRTVHNRELSRIRNSSKGTA